MIFFGPSTPVVQGAKEAFALVDRYAERRGLFERARLRAEELERPLVVVGSPDRSVGFSCGDVPCVHPFGCARCGAAPADVARPGGIGADDDTIVVFTCDVLEHVDDAEATYAEILRCAGHFSNVFVARLQKWATWTRLGSAARRLIVEAPPQQATFKAIETSRPPRQIAGSRRRIAP
jgi:hypothetical protein